MNFLERVISNYFLAWRNAFNYLGKTKRIPFWHFFFIDGLIYSLLAIYSSKQFLSEETVMYALENNIEWASLYSVFSFFAYLSLAIRRLRDSGKENLVFWTLCSFIPVYNLYLFSQPSSDEDSPK